MICAELRPLLAQQMAIHSPSRTGEYSKDRLKELQQKTARLPASKPAAPADPAPFKISGSFKPAGTPKDDRFLVSQCCRCANEPAATNLQGLSMSRNFAGPTTTTMAMRGGPPACEMRKPKSSC